LNFITHTSKKEPDRRVARGDCRVGPRGRVFLADLVALIEERPQLRTEPSSAERRATLAEVARQDEHEKFAVFTRQSE
jgi:hypothetical protein